MKLLHDRILKDGVVREGNILKVDSFLNHQMDISLLNEIGKEFKSRFAGEKVDKILTIEASGIGVAAIVAQYFNNAPVVFAKKTESLNLDTDLYQTKVYSYTKQKEYSIRVGKKFLNKDDNILIIDDFLAKGCASKGLIEIIKQSEANIIGVGIVIEKGFQEGRKILEKERIRVESLAIIDSLDDNIVKFR